MNSLQWLEVQSQGNLAVEDSESELLLVNGQVEPVVHLQAGRWYRWRMLLVSLNRHLKLSLPAACQTYLLATDGIYVQGAPRKVRRIPFASGNRVDIAVRCAKPGKFEIWTYNGIPAWKTFLVIIIAFVSFFSFFWFAAPTMLISQAQVAAEEQEGSPEAIIPEQQGVEIVPADASEDEHRRLVQEQEVYIDVPVS